MSNIGSGTTTALDLVAGRKRGDVATGGGSEALALSTDGRELWVAARAEGHVAIVDTGSLAVTAALRRGRGLPRATGPAGGWVGVVVTPWFMNLTVLPSADDLKAWVAGGSARLGFPSGAYDFIVSALDGVGLIGACSLFSTMFEFTDHEAAQLAASTVAKSVFPPEQPPAPSVSRRQLPGG